MHIVDNIQFITLPFILAWLSCYHCTDI